MPVDYSQPSWQGGKTDAGRGLQRVLGMLAQQQQMKQQADQFTANKNAAAAKAQAQAQLQQAISQIDPKDPDAQRKASMVMLRFSPQLGGGGGAAAALKGLAPPPKPQQIQQVPIPGGQPAPQTPFKGQLDSILKGAGVTPKAPAPPSANAVFDPNKGTYVFPAALNRAPIKPPMPRQQAIPRVPTGSTWSGPGTPPPHFETPVNRPTVKDTITRPGEVVLRDGLPIFTNTQPKSVSGAASLPKLSDTELNLLSPQDRTNYVNSIAGAQTNILGSAKAPDSNSKSVPAGTKVTNAKGETKWTKTEGDLPEGWKVAQ